MFYLSWSPFVASRCQVIDRHQWWCFTCNGVPGCWQTDNSDVLPVMITSYHIQGAKSLTDRWAEEFSDLAGLEGQTDTDFWNKLQEHWQEADRWRTLWLWPLVVTMCLFVNVTQVVWTAISPTPVHTATHASAVLPAYPAAPLPLYHVIKVGVFLGCFNTSSSLWEIWVTLPGKVQ